MPVHAQEAGDEIITAEYHIIQKGETLHSLAQSFDLGFDELLHANPQITNPKLIRLGEKITLPTAHLIPDAKRDGIVINLAELRLYFFSDEEEITFPISIGADERTPIGKTKISDKRENPSWIPPDSVRAENPNLPEIVFSGPDNPLGNYALYLDASRNAKWDKIAIHGTNAPRSIGSKVSHGCIRLYPQDIEELFSKVKINTPIEIVNQPIKADEINNKIYIEAHFNSAPDLVSEEMGVKKIICKKIANCDERVDWSRVDEAVTENSGILIDVTKRQTAE